MKNSTALFLILLVSTSTFAQSPLFFAKEKGKLYGYIDDKGTYVIPPIYKEAGYFTQDLAVVKLGTKYGIINKKGEMVVPATYEKALLYAPEGKMTVMKAGKWGVIDGTGKTIIPFNYEVLSVFKGGYVVGGTIITSKYFKNHVCPFVLNERGDTVYRQEDCSDDPRLLQGVVDKKKNYISETWWPLVREGRLLLEQTAYSPEGNDPTPVTLVSVTSPDNFFSVYGEVADNYTGFREGVLAISKKGGDNPVGKFVDSTGTGTTYFDDNSEFKSITDLALDVVHPFFNGVAGVEKDGKWAFMDHQGWIISQTELPVADYHAAPPMYYGGLIGFFNKEFLVGYVDIKGTTVIPFQFQEYHPFEYDVTAVKYKGLYGLLKKDGTWAVQPKFEDLAASPCPCLQ